MKLVDTSSWIEYLRGRTSAVADRVRDLMREDEAAVCEMVLVELWNGAQGAAEKRALRELQEVLPVLPINAAVWIKAMKLAQACRASGVTVPAVDVVVAACAFHHGVELEHCDAHYGSIQTAWASAG